MGDAVIGIEVRVIDAPALRARRGEFVALVADAVEGGASVGFMLSVSAHEYERHWDIIAVDVESGYRLLLACERDGEIVGAVQLVPCGKTNGRHRAEVQKLLVPRAARSSGIGERLMHEADRLATERGRVLLLLDTRMGSAAERLYRRLGWRAFGVVPDYALDPDGTPAACAFFYKRRKGETR